MKIVDMGRAKPKGKGKDGASVVGWSGEEEGPRVHLDHDRMKKIGMAKPPATGDEYHIQGHARVVGSREEPARDGGSGPVHSIEIILHHLGAEPKAAGDGRQSIRDDVDAATRAVESRDKASTRETSVQGKAQREKSQRSEAPAEQKVW
jgi:hypothetical protein